MVVSATFKIECILPKVNTHMDTPNTPVNRKTAWWLEHKDDPKYIECMREARKKYYYKNHEQEKKRALEYYYKRKALLAARPTD